MKIIHLKNKKTVKSNQKINKKMNKYFKMTPLNQMK
jgi:hypothetical protein